jgi:hypothetical protein
MAQASQSQNGAEKAERHFLFSVSALFLRWRSLRISAAAVFADLSVLHD